MRNSRKNKFTLATLLVFISGAQVLAQFDAPPANVRVAKASFQMIAAQTMVPGTVVSRNDAKLAAEVTGRLVEVVDVGTQVARGEMVAKIEDTSLILRRDELRAEVTRSKARLSFLESEEKRYVTLTDSNLAAATKLEETRSDRDVSRGDLQVAESRLAQAEDRLARTTIAAPFDGVVVQRLQMPGERVDTGDTVVRMVDQQHLEVIARAPLEYYSFVESGQQLEIRAGSVVTSGIVRTVVAIGTENTHLFELRLDIKSNEFPVGQTLRVSVPTSNKRNALLVPRDALVLRPESISVFIVDQDQKAKQVLVTTGVGTNDQIEVFGDLADGDVVIIRGNERLRPGQAVSIMQS